MRKQAKPDFGAVRYALDRCKDKGLIQHYSCIYTGTERATPYFDVTLISGHWFRFGLREAFAFLKGVEVVEKMTGKERSKS